eukprot:scaffold840_cov344-Pavlova_lutheri.AAC.110
MGKETGSVRIKVPVRRVDVDSDAGGLQCGRPGWLGAWNQPHAIAGQLQESWKPSRQSRWKEDDRQNAIEHPTPPAANADEPHPMVPKTTWPKGACSCAPDPPGASEASDRNSPRSNTWTPNCNDQMCRGEKYGCACNKTRSGIQHTVQTNLSIRFPVTFRCRNVCTCELDHTLAYVSPRCARRRSIHFALPDLLVPSFLTALPARSVRSLRRTPNRICYTAVAFQPARYLFLAASEDGRRARVRCCSGCF